MRVAIYARVSTERQAEQFGLEAQLTTLRRRAAERQYTMVRDGATDAFTDDGYSGGELERPALGRLRQAVSERQVDMVLVHDPDRLSRNLSHLLLLADEIERCGARLEFLTQEVDQSPEGRMFFAMRGAVAEYEKAKIRERTARGRIEKARQGKVVNPRSLPYGYCYDKASQKVELDQEKAQVVRLAFALLVEDGLTVRGIARRLTELGIPTPTGGSHWQASTISHWLRNLAYKGEYCQLRYQMTEPEHPRNAVRRRRKSSRQQRPQEEWHHVAIPPIVSERIWDAAQARLDRNKALARRNAKRQYLLQGLVRCGACGARMSGWHRNHRYYRCSRYGQGKANVHGEYCHRIPVRADHLEEAVWDTISQLLQEPDTLIQELHCRQVEGSPTRETMEQELEACRRQLQVIPKEQMLLVEGYGKGLVPDDLMRERMTELQSNLVAVKERAAELEHRLLRLEITARQEEQALAFAERIRQGIGALDFAGRREVLRLLVEDVTVSDEEALVRTIIPLEPPKGKVQLCPNHRKGVQGNSSGFFVRLGTCPDPIKGGNLLPRTPLIQVASSFYEGDPPLIASANVQHPPCCLQHDAQTHLGLAIGAIAKHDGHF